MAPKKTKKPSMMQRQRQLSAQQQQVKRASSSKLPPGKKGGAVTKPQTAKPTATSKPSPISKVRVRDLGPTPPKQLSGASQRALPPGTKGGSLARGAAAKAGGAGRVLGAAGAALGVPLAIKNIKDVADQNKRWDDYKKRTGISTKLDSTQRTGRFTKTKPAAEPAAKPDKPEGSVNRRGRFVPAKPNTETKPANVADYKDAQGNVYDGNTGRLKTAAKPKPKPKPAAPAAAKPKPKAPSKPVAKPSETYKDGGKGLYQGSKEYRDKVGGSGNPLLNRFRRDMGRDAKTGERQYSTPEDKSKYVDKNGKLKIQDKPKPQPTAAKSKPPTSKTGGNTPITASKPMEGGTPFNTRNRFETPEQRKKRLAREGRA
jgi:hypothetical protein